MKRYIAASPPWFICLILAGCVTKPSPVVPFALPTPMAPKAVALSQQPKSYSVMLSWLPYVDEATAIVVWEGTSPDRFNAVMQVPTTSTSAVVGGLGYNVQYYFRLSASGPGGTSPPSEIVWYFKQNSQKPGSGGPYGSVAQ